MAPWEKNIAKNRGNTAPTLTFLQFPTFVGILKTEKSCLKKIWVYPEVFGHATFFPPVKIVGTVFHGVQLRTLL